MGVTHRGIRTALCPLWRAVPRRATSGERARGQAPQGRVSRVLSVVVVTRTITGRLLYQELERSVSRLPAAFGGFLQVSGIRFTY